jgi:hypothetical protein
VIIHTIVKWVWDLSGARDEGGTAYGIWSGIGGAFPDFLILGGLITVYRTHNCAHKPCRRIGKHTTKDGHRLCRVHLAMPASALELPEIHADHR